MHSFALCFGSAIGNPHYYIKLKPNIGLQWFRLACLRHGCVHWHVSTMIVCSFLVVMWACRRPLQATALPWTVVARCSMAISLNLLYLRFFPLTHVPGFDVIELHACACCCLLVVVHVGRLMGCTCACPPSAPVKQGTVTQRRRNSTLNFNSTQPQFSIPKYAKTKGP